MPRCEKGQGRAAGSLCVVGWECYQGRTAGTAGVWQRCLPSLPCAVAWGISVPFPLSASPSPRAVCYQPRAQMAHPLYLLYLRALPACSVRCSDPSEERGRMGGSQPFPEPSSFSLTAARTFGSHLPAPFLSSSLPLCTIFSFPMRAAPASQPHLNP